MYFSFLWWAHAFEALSLLPFNMAGNAFFQVGHGIIQDGNYLATVVGCSCVQKNDEEAILRWRGGQWHE